MKKTAWNDGWLFGRTGSEERTSVILPHDAMLHEKRMADAPGGSAQAYFPGGKYCYEKVFTATPDLLSGHAILEFEGIYKNAVVFVNGGRAGGTAYGYRTFFVDLDGKLREGENTVTVTCENSDQPDSRWYSGAGIYRPVWLWTGPSKDTIPPEQVRVTTIAIEPPTICVETGMAQAQIEIMERDGEAVIAAASGDRVEIMLPGARLWSEETPVLYRARVRSSTDEAEVIFGIRQITWDHGGLYLNGERTLLRGGCVHHDHGVLGAATWDEAEWRRVRILKDAGFNAIRSAHNPASRAMLEACDALGMYVMDETWDMWFHHKSKYDYADVWEANFREDIRALVDRDVNHPSVILYSIGNEVSEPAKEKGIEREREMVELIHRLDPTRPVTGGFNLMIIASAAKGKGVYKEDGGRDESGDQKMQGMNSTMFNLITNMVGTGMNKSANGKKADKATTPALDMLDIAGYNYASGRYPKEGKAHPDRLIFGSETFPQDIWKNWQMVKQYPYLIGDFMWTAWDYLGEVGIGAWSYTADGKGFNKPYPWLLAEAGAFDILGDPNGEMYLAQATWGKLRAPAIAVQPVNHPDVKPARAVWRGTNALPSWSWQGCEGNTAVVEVYTADPLVELYLNDKKFGQRKTKNGKATFKVKYQEGELKAVALNASGQPMGERILKSASGELRAAPCPEKKEARPGEIVFVPVLVKDKQGVTECNADRFVSVSVEGGILLGFGSANPRTEERFDAGAYTTYYGRALAVVRIGEDKTVKITVNDNGHTETADINVIR